MEGSHAVPGDALPEAQAAPRRRGRRGRVLRIIGIVFLLAAVSIGGYLGWLLWGTGLTTRRAQSDLRQGFEGRVATQDPSAGPTADQVVKVPGRAVAILVIPRMDLDMVVVEGTGTESLKKGPGHYTQTAYPWEDSGRVGIAGHRTTYGAPFWDLDKLREGDRITLETEFGIFEYRVTRQRIIVPSESWVLDQTKQPTLVLTTCNPRFSAAQRLVVFADRVGG
ncbi:MAG TPA: sortase [Actinomycetota bacterium]|nr:sortase [Actinomycetota bacterium]